MSSERRYQSSTEDPDCSDEPILDYSDAAIDLFIAESYALLREAGMDIADAELLTSETTTEVLPSNNSIEVITLDDDDDAHNNTPTTSEIICIEDSIYVPRVVPRFRNAEIIDLCSPSSPKRNRINTDKKPIEFKILPPIPVRPKPKPVEAPSENMCPVCLEDFKKNCPTTTTCGHVFCGPCIQKCVKGYQKCPTCNKKLNVKNLIKLYI